MKPKLLGRIDPAKAKFSQRDLKSFARERGDRLGEIAEILSADEAREISEASSVLKAFAKTKGLAHRQTRDFFASEAVFSCAGSIGYHTDHGLGLALTWILYEEELSKYSAQNSQLVTRDGCLFVGVGDVFLFNGNAGHCWVSNRATVFAQIAVKQLPSILL